MISATSNDNNEDFSYSYGYYFPPADQSNPYSKLDINCTKQGFTAKVLCQQYIKDFIMAYTGNMEGSATIPKGMPNQSYNRLQIPYTGDPLTQNPPVYVELELSDLVNLDTQNGVIYITAYITLLWRDERFQWDLKYANVSKSYVDMNWIWIPDITLYNKAGDSNIVEAPALLFNDGSVKLRRIAFFSAYCAMDIENFPFDGQVCTLDLASWAGHLTVEAAPKQIKHPFRNNLISPQFVDSMSYALQSFTVKNIVMDQGGTQKKWPFVQYTIKVKRNSKFFMSTTIIPMLLVTVICVVGLWVNDINSRLGLTITCLLTVMAIGWSVTSNLPVSNYSTWIQDFSNFCTMLIAVCCIENACVAYFQSKSAGSPPPWIKYVIEASNCFSRVYDRIYYYFVDNCCDWFCNIYKFFYTVRKPRRRRLKKNEETIIELRKMSDEDNISNNNNKKNNNDIESADDEESNKKFDSDDEIQSSIDNNDPNSDEEMNFNKNDYINSSITSNEDRITITPTIVNPLQNSTASEATFDIEVHDNNTTNNNDDDTNENFPLIQQTEKDLSWYRVGRAFDRFTRLLLPLVLIIGLSYYFRRARST